MISGAEVNADPKQVAAMDTNGMQWEPAGQPGAWKKVLERVVDAKKGRETALVRLDAGVRLPDELLSERVETFVIEGDYSDGHGEYGAHTFIRNPEGTSQAPSTRNGCVLYVKRRVPIRSGAARFVIDAKTAQWMAFPHRGADVLHLYPNADGIETGRIGNVHPHRKIPSHDHSIGEETFVLRGCLADEYTAYTPGMWFRMPCGVPHAPFTEAAGCMMLIREGDLVW